MRLWAFALALGLLAGCAAVPRSPSASPVIASNADDVDPLASPGEERAAVAALSRCANRVIPAVDDGKSPADKIGRTALTLCHASYDTLVETASRGKDSAFASAYERALNAPKLFARLVRNLRAYERRHATAGIERA